MKKIILLTTLFIAVSCVNESEKQDTAIDIGYLNSDINSFFDHYEIKNAEVRELNNRGIELVKKGEIKEGEEFFIKAYRIEPENPIVLTNLGNVYLKIGTQRMAREYYNEAFIHSDSTLFIAAYNLGLSFCNDGLYEESQEILEYIISKTNDKTRLAIANYTLATVFVNMNKCSQAKKLFVSVKNTLSEYPDFTPKMDSLEEKIKNCLY